MKKIYFLTSIILLISIRVSGQNYQTFYSNRIMLYADENSLVKAVRFDSVKYAGDSVFYPFRNIDEIDFSCYSPFAPSWIGDKIVINNNFSLFFNREKDTVKIQTDAKINEEWQMYKKDQLSINGKVVNIDTLTVLGIKDSVKTISFQAYDNSTPTAHSINSMTIKISKNYGLVKTLNFNFFPDLSGVYNYLKELNLVGISNPKLGIQNLTWMEVFDHEIGDELHILHINKMAFLGNYDTTKMKKKYISKQFVGDTIFYEYRLEESYVRKQSGSIVVGTNVDTITLKIFSDSVFDNLPEVPYFENDGNFMSMYFLSNGEVVTKTKPTGHHIYAKADDTCWMEILADGCFPDESYMKGLGGPYGSCIDIISFGYYESKLVYYKKGGKVWGTPFDFVVKTREIKSFENDFKIYVNPTEHTLSVTCNKKDLPYSIEILDMNGKCCYKAKIRSSEYTYPINLTGLYLYRIISKGNIKTGKIVF